MIVNSQLIKEALDAPLKNAGFKKKSNNWYWSNDEVVLLINLQKSQYGEQYYVNLGINLKSIESIEYPKENSCHIRFRLSSISNQEIDLLFNLESKSLPDIQRKNDITTLMNDVGLPFLKKCLTQNNIVENIKGGIFKKAMINKLVKDLIY